MKVAICDAMPQICSSNRRADSSWFAWLGGCCASGGDTVVVAVITISLIERMFSTLSGGSDIPAIPDVPAIPVIR